MKKWLVLIILASFLFVSTFLLNQEGESAERAESWSERVGTEEVSETDRALGVVESNLQYAEEEDLEAYVDTLAAGVQEERTTEIEELFENADVNYEIVGTDVVIESTSTIVLLVEQKAVATDLAEGYEFTDSIAEVQYSLAKEEGEWKVFSKEVMAEAPIEE
ncbi:hypothetical protein [Oceanobacillus salinisoli]|uniref:hypothetical protein n=1 Tax=Oceanobacillus salinisoli TaxID=2678611 RepID=UPI0012E1A695|nr:hypothetical protein [Oceanobacillus salinisoli]